ncbi:MAG: NADH-quinone oxidoreductase subunit NuoK [Candidatus Hydrogenedentes bacterium]|nr:NADH-quinone oxidoreductase subunit NuoK [Candidatus Hydrogenedentota bacterium]
MIEFLANHTPTLTHWLVLCALLFCIGLYGVLTRRNAIGILMSIEIMLDAGAINFVAFNYFNARDTVDGQIMAIFIIAVAAAEAVIAMAIFVALYRYRGTVDVNEMDSLRDES